MFQEEFGQTYKYDKEYNQAQQNISDRCADWLPCLSAVLSLIGVATATPHSFALHMEQGFCVNPGNPVQGTWVTRTFTADKNHVSSVTDAGGNVVKYT